MNVLDLFSGIGGFSLGLERAGMRTVAFCEIDPYCRAVLAKHWPGVPCYDDIRTLTADRLAADGIRVDVICGGFPCQDISIAGKGVGLEGARSGLWSEYARLIGELRPQFVIVENVAMLRGRGLGNILGTLAELGYDAEWHCIPAFAVGAPHIRDRIWIVAHPGRERNAGRREASDLACQTRANQSKEKERERHGDAASNGGPTLADADNGKWEQCGPFGRMGWAMVAANDLASAEERTVWPPEPNIPRVVDGLPNRLDRLRCLGNAVVPQIPEIIGKAIMKAAATAAGGS